MAVGYGIWFCVLTRPLCAVKGGFKTQNTLVKSKKFA
jgi:hypothetical protein